MENFLGMGFIFLLATGVIFLVVIQIAKSLGRKQEALERNEKILSDRDADLEISSLSASEPNDILKRMRKKK